jgi:flagellar basal-body rod protein FlgC
LDFLKTLIIAVSGPWAQAGRMRIISENITNADSTQQRPGADPYRRKIPTSAANLTGARRSSRRARQSEKWLFD